jgi:TolA-binding protein
VGQQARGGDEESPRQRVAAEDADEDEDGLVTRVAAVSSSFVVWVLVTAATPLPLAPPPPDLTALVPFVSAPLDKPTIKLPVLAMPAPPIEVPAIPPAAPVRPAADKPTATMPPRRTLPCVGAWTGAAGEALECGRAQLMRGDLTDAVQNLERAARNADDRAVATEARYWLGETFYRLGRLEPADTQFTRVAQERSPALSPFALHGSGWIALVLGDTQRAHDAFAQLLASTHPLAVDAWARHGLGLTQSALGRHADAQRTWADLLARRPGPALERDAIFWNGDALGRIGQADRAAAELTRFVQGGPHPLLSAGLARLAWWSLVAGRPKESVATLRAYPGPPMPQPKPEAGKPLPPRVGSNQEAADRDWIDATQTLALLASDDWNGARAPAQALAARRSPLALPVQLRVAAGALARRDNATVDAMVAELVGGTLTPAVRAWVLTLKGEAARAEGKADDARTQYDLARGIDAGSEVGRYATLRIAQINLEMREFAQAVTDLAPLSSAPGDPAMRASVLVLQGEAAYRAGDPKASAAAFERLLTEAPERPEVRAARLGLGWTALREGRADEAGRRFVEFARLYPDDEHAPDALVLASEMALGAGDLRGGKELLERVLARYPSAPRAEFARLNRGILMVRSGEAVPAAPLLRDWAGRAPFPPLLGRARIALGVALLGAGRAGEARGEFLAAKREGEGALASLGFATAALAEDKLAEAASDFAEAKNDGTAPVAAAASYGLAAVAFRRHEVAAFKTAATSLIDATPRAASTPALLYALVGVAAEAKDWPAALATAKRLVNEFPGDARADDGLERVGAAAANEHAWPVAYEAYALLHQKYPKSPFIEDSRVAFAESQVETGRAAEGRKALEQFFATAPADARTARARITLGKARELTGDRAGALDAYTQAARAVPPAQWNKDTQLGYARLLTQARRFGEARGLLEPLIKASPAPVAAEGALALGETFHGQGDEAAASEYFMTAAYVAPDSAAGRRGLLAAGRAFAALKQPEAATTVYRKLLAQPNVPADLADAARRGLAEIGR